MKFSKIKFALGPMAGYTDAAFRILCKEHGAELTITELISAESIVRHNEEGFRLAFVPDEEKKHGPTGIQLFGSDPKKIAHAAALVEKNASFIDLNFGCPAPKITRSMGGGAALLKKPELIREIVEEVATTISKPVTAKMRLGIDDSNKAVEIAKTIEQAGASALFVHARTLKQGYSGEPDWSKINEIKSSVSIPIFGNGNVRSYSDAEKMFNETKCDGVMIGRAALGNPFIFEMCKKKKDFEVSFEMKKAGFLRYLKLVEMLKMRKSISDLRVQALAFARGFKNASELRAKISKAKDKEELLLAFSAS